MTRLRVVVARTGQANVAKGGQAQNVILLVKGLTRKLASADERSKLPMVGSLSPTSVARLAKLRRSALGRDVRSAVNIFAIADDWRLAESALANSQIANPRLTLRDRQRIGRPSVFRVLRSGGLSDISRSYGLR